MRYAVVLLFEGESNTNASKEQIESRGNSPETPVISKGRMIIYERWNLDRATKTQFTT